MMNRLTEQVVVVMQSQMGQYRRQRPRRLLRRLRLRRRRRLLRGALPSPSYHSTGSERSP